MSMAALLLQAVSSNSRTTLYLKASNVPYAAPAKTQQKLLKSTFAVSEQLGTQSIARADYAETSPIDAPSAPPIAQPVPTRVAHRLSMAVVMHCAATSYSDCSQGLRSNVEHAEVRVR